MPTDPTTPGRVLRGVLEDGDARPLAGARVRLDAGGDEALAATDGAFGLRLPDGAAGDDGRLLGLRVAVAGRETRVLVASDARDGVRVVVVPTDAVPVRVLTPGAAPVPARFGWDALRRTDAGLVPGPSGVATAPRFSARGLAPGSWALVVWGGPFLPAVVEPLVLDGRVSPTLVTVELARRGASVAGRVLSSANAPRPGARVTLRPEDPLLVLPAARASTLSDAGGRWRVEGVPPGRYVVVVDAAGPAAEQPLHLLEREERSMDLVV